LLKIHRIHFKAEDWGSAPPRVFEIV